MTLQHHGANLWVQWGKQDRIILTHIDPLSLVTTDTLGIGISPDLFA